MNKHAAMRAKASKRKHLRALADAQAFQASIWSTVNYRHGTKDFKDHGTYGKAIQRDNEGRKINA